MSKTYEIRNLKDGIADVIHICVKCGAEITSKAKINKKGTLATYVKDNRFDSSHHLSLNWDVSVNDKPENCVILTGRNPLSRSSKPQPSNTICKSCYNKLMIEEDKKRPALIEEAKKIIAERKEYRLKIINQNIEDFDDIVSEILNKVILTLDEIYFNFHLKNGKDVSIKDITAVKFVKGWVNIETEKGDYHFYNESYETNYRYEDFNKKKPSIFRKAGKKGSYIKLTEEETKKYSKHTCEDVKKAEPHYYEDSQGIYL
jgi:hypothetical protein